jgi:hypothetical protein
MDDNILINKTKPVNNGLKRKRSQFTSPLQKAKTTLGNHLNPTPAESDDEEYSGSDGSKYNNEDETVSEDDLSNFPSKRRKVEVYAKIPVLVNDQLVLPKDISNKRFKCEVPGCGKSYKKPSRLREHERSHTGEARMAQTWKFESNLTQNVYSALIFAIRPAAANPTFVNLICKHTQGPIYHHP